MLPIKRISHATFETPDVARLADYYVGILGLSPAGQDGGETYLKTGTGLTSVRLRRGEVARCAGIAFQVDPSLPLAEAERLLNRAGVRSERARDRAPGIGETLAFDDPKGTRIEVFADASFLDEDRTPKGFTPLKLGHLAFKVDDIQAIVAFYRDVLGFRVSDWRQDFFVFMRCGPDHHTVNFATAEKVKMHHIAFEVKDMAEMTRACDFLGKNGYRLLWGPGRHVIGDNVFTYHRDPDGHIIELYCELARVDSEEIGYFVPRPWRDDRPYRPTTWGAETLGNLWGPGPAPGFGD